ncbi:CopG family transcriptional regulator [Lachnoanaerobaculum orale]|jgi:ribbon-helix-helix protein, copG family|uniref:CopG family transcriptional regulator n=1 Tax=Lachnoanaerobaculum orale TaxID=979627 RepID=UPI0023A81AD2|nr:CopG family transcriptional regulator [Lachnoanaerobaculum orale]
MANKDLIIKHKRAKGDDGYRTFSIRIKEEIVSKLDNISTQTGHSRNELIGLLLEYEIENCRVEEK